MDASELLRNIFHTLKGELAIGGARVRVGEDASGNFAGSSGTRNTSVSARIEGNPGELQQLFGPGSVFTITATFSDGMTPEKSEASIRF